MSKNIERKLKLYISMSLDGFIARKNDDISWLNAMDQEGEDYGYFDFVKGVDTYIIGRQTYDVVRGLLDGKFPQSEQYDCYIITREDRANTDGVTFYNGSVKSLIEEIRTKPGGDIYCDGGGQIVQLFMKEDLIDEYIVSVIPIILGDGKRLFLGGAESLNIKLVGTKSFDSGLVQLHYVRDRNGK